jgi:AmmeMemoRadiSam system protein A
MEIDMPEVMLNEEEKTYLLRFARQVITQTLRGIDAEWVSSGEMSAQLKKPGAAFVTLHTRDGLLRGCIGSLRARVPLIEDVENNAKAAAFEDPRFPPLSLRELPNIIIEISVLSPPRPLRYSDAADLLQKLRPGVDGVVLEKDWHRATFLPQVWDQLPKPTEFLGNLCYKAGLPANAWKDNDIKISTYQVEEFSEED